MQVDVESVHEHKSKKQRAYEMAREFFATCNDLVQQLTLVLGREDFLMEPATFRRSSDGREYVVGTQHELPPQVQSGVRKKDVLGHPSSVFDCVRWDFMITGDPMSSTNTFYDRLLDLQCNIPPAKVAEIAGFMDALRCCSALQTVAAGEGVHHFVHDLWEVYVEALQDEKYYLLSDEVLMLCILSKQSVEIYRNNNGQLQPVNKCVFAGSSLVAIKVDEDGKKRARSHFERIHWQGQDAGPASSGSSRNKQKAGA